MQAACRRAEQVAPSEASVLITGESGTGKEVLARHIHRRSPPRRRPVRRAELRRDPGEPAGIRAVRPREGRLHAARSPAASASSRRPTAARCCSTRSARWTCGLQAKLLRAMQEREIDRVGGARPVKVNVRILATTNRDLRAEVARGAFREDLYFRLNVVTLRVPPLARAARRHRRARRAFRAPLRRGERPADRPLSRAALSRLAAHGWRGNVRELENAIHRAVLLADGAEIGPEAIELGARRRRRATPPRRRRRRRAGRPHAWRRSSAT